MILPSDLSQTQDLNSGLIKRTAHLELATRMVRWISLMYRPPPPHLSLSFVHPALLIPAHATHSLAIEEERTPGLSWVKVCTSLRWPGPQLTTSSIFDNLSILLTFASQSFERQSTYLIFQISLRRLLQTGQVLKKVSLGSCGCQF